MNIAGLIEKRIRDILGIGEEGIRLELKKTGILNVFCGTFGTELAGVCYKVFMHQGLYPSFHLIVSEEDGLPYNIPRTLLDNNGGGKVYHKFNPIVRANHDKIVSELDSHKESVAIQYGTPIGATGSNSDSYAEANSECGRAVLNVLSVRRGNHAANEIENIVGNVHGFLEVREEWGNIMEVFVPRLKASDALVTMGNFCFVVNNSAAQRSCNPNDLHSRVEKYPFGILLSEMVTAPPRSNPSQLYKKMFSQVQVLEKKGFLNKDGVELTVFIHGPPDVLEYKDTIVGYAREALIDSGISVKGNFEPFLSYNYLASNRNLWVHTIVPTDMEEYCRLITGRRAGRRRKNAK